MHVLSAIEWFRGNMSDYRDSDANCPNNNTAVELAGAKGVTQPASRPNDLGWKMYEDTPEVSDFEIPATSAMLSFVRRRAVQFATTLPFTPEQIEDIKLAVGEATSNAVKHGSEGDNSLVRVRLERLSNAIRVRITDLGNGFNLSDSQSKHGEAAIESGRGLMCMHAVMDNVDYHFDEDGTSVELTKYFNE